jgi:hypothetical protein
MLLTTANHGCLRAYEVLPVRWVCDDGRVGFAEHLERFFPDRTHAVIAPVRSDVQDLLPGFRVLRVEPGASGEPWVYATCGAAQAADGDGEGAEYVLLAPSVDAALAEMLAALAKVNAGAAAGLGVGSVIALGRPWLPGSFANHLVVLPPYAFDAGFELLEEDGRRTVVLWLVPVTGAEAQHVRERGYEELVRQFEQRSVNVASPRRASVV